MPSLTQAELIKRAEKIREYQKLAPSSSERLHINRGRQLMYELLKDVFGDPLIAPSKLYSGDWEMLFTNVGVDALTAAITLQQQAVQQKTTDEQQRKVELVLLKLATYTTNQVKAMLLDTGIDFLSMKKPGDMSSEGIVRRLENDIGKGPTPPPNQTPFTWQIILEQQAIAGLRAWVAYEINVLEYQINNAPPKEEKDKDKINFESIVLKNKLAYLKQVLRILPE
jgi:hypothetical protein